MTQVKDIPQDLLNKINEQFEANPKIRELRVQQAMFMRQGRCEDALSLGKRIEYLRNRCVYEYIEESECQVQTVDVSDMDMPTQEKEKMMQLFLVCFMCADMIESSVMDMDSILHKYDKNLSLETFNDMREVMKLSKEKLKYLQQNSGYMQGLVWADNCDNMYELLKNKAASIMRKRKK